MAEKVFNAYIANFFSKEVSDPSKFRIKPPTHTWNLLFPPNLPLWPHFVEQARVLAGQEVHHYNYTRFAIEVPLAGELFCRQRGVEMLVKPGQIYLIHYGEDSYFTPGPSGFCRKIGFGLAGPMLSTILAESGLTAHLCLQLKSPRRFFKTLAVMRRAILKYRYENASEFAAAGFQMLSELALLIDHEQPELLTRAVAVMKANLSQMLTVSELAEKLDTSSSTLENLFSEHLGSSPRRYLMNLKLEKAKLLLQSTDLPVKQIGINVGYLHPMHFSRWFKKSCGLTPGEYRLRNSTSLSN